MVAPVLSTIHQSLATAAGRQREQAQHAPRPARVRFAVKTTGIGESRLTGAQAIDFGALMLDEPTFSFGVIAVSSLASGELPLATAIVLSYITNANGMYTGAEVAFRVESTKTNLQLKFSLTFEASTLRTNVGNGTDTKAVPPATNDFQGPALNPAGL